MHASLMQIDPLIPTFPSSPPDLFPHHLHILPPSLPSFRDVLRIIEQGLEKFPGNVELRYFEASSLHALGNFERAVSRADLMS